jgi:hypothetical protein
VKRRPLLASLVEENDYYRTAYYLGTALYGTGKPRSAGLFWTFLAGQEAAGEWQVRAQNQLRNPSIDRALENP